MYANCTRWVLQKRLLGMPLPAQLPIVFFDLLNMCSDLRQRLTCL